MQIKSYYKGENIFDDSKRIDYFNPYEYNLESTLKDEENIYSNMPKSKGNKKMKRKSNN